MKYLNIIFFLSIFFIGCSEKENKIEITINSKIIFCNDQEGVFMLSLPEMSITEITKKSYSGVYFGNAFFKKNDTVFCGEIVEKSAEKSQARFVVNYTSVHPFNKNLCFRNEYISPLNAPEKTKLKTAECAGQNFIDAVLDSTWFVDARMGAYNIKIDTLKMYVPALTAWNKKGDCVFVKAQSIYFQQKSEQQKLFSFTETFDFDTKNGVFDVAIDEEGKRIIYVVWKSRINDHVFSTENRCELAMYNIESGERDFLIQSNIRKPKFSPDGKYICFVDGENNLVILDIEKKQSMRMVKCNDFI